MSPCLLSLLFFLISVVIGSESTVVYVSNYGIDDPTCLNGGSQSCANLTLKSICIHLSPGSEVIPNNDIHDNVST